MPDALNLYPYFTSKENSLLLISAVIILASIICFSRQQRVPALILLFCGSLSLGLFTATFDHFLVLWDEQFHALVAKNMMQHPFSPMLIANPVLPVDYTNWMSNQIWVHKQPLFLWQIAISLKLFGVNELAVRIPSIILHSLNALFIYRIGKLTVNERAGFYAAVFFTCANYLLELAAGKYPTDHNDTSFLFYISASFWAWLEYLHSQKKGWLLLVGLFAGSAVLVKWLVGLLVFPTWFGCIVTDKSKRFHLLSYIPLTIAFVISLVTFVPWQVYIFTRFPAEAQYELLLVNTHLTDVIEGNGGPWWFHFKALSELYGPGDILPWFLLLGLIFYIREARTLPRRLTMIIPVVITYSLYTFAPTKLNSFCIIVSPFIFIGIGVFFDFILSKYIVYIKWKQAQVILTTAVISLVSFGFLNIEKIQLHHTDWKPDANHYREYDYRQMECIRKVQATLPHRSFVIFNAAMRKCGEIPMMFYTNHIAYGFIPTQEQIEITRAKNYPIAVIEKDSLPDYILNDSLIIRIKQ